MSPDAYDDRFRLNRQLGIFIKKISRINCYVTSSSTRTSNSSKKIAAQNIFLRRKDSIVVDNHCCRESISWSIECNL